jgi:hypothetical protein
MYLFSRRARLAGGNTRKAMTWSIGITEKVNQITGLGVNLYSQVFSPEVGTLVWSAFVPDLATLEAASDKLTADDGFISMTDEGSALTTDQLDDSLVQVLHGQPDPNRHVEYATVVQAVCANGSVARGIEVGMEIAQRAERATGTPTMFVASTTGVYGSVGWITGHSDIRAVEAAQGALMADASFGEFVDREAGKVYAEQPNLTTQLLYRQLA